MGIENFPYRKDFPILCDSGSLTYLDSAATSLKPVEVIDSVVDFYQNYTAPVSRSHYKNSLQATEAVATVRAEMAGFLNAKSNEIIFTHNCTDALNLVAQCIQVNDDEEIILSKLNHHSCILPFLQHKNIKYVNTTVNGLVDLEHLKTIISERTKLVAVTYVSNVLGNIQPVKEIIEIAKKHKALTLIDAAQATGHFPVDVRKLDCDFLAISAHKMLAPSGVGVLYGKKSSLKQLSTYRYGGGMINVFSTTENTVKEGCERFEAGTPNIEGIIGLGGALAYYRKIGINNVETYLDTLDDYFYKRLQTSFLKDYAYPINKSSHIPIYTFRFAAKLVSAHDMAMMLSNSYDIAVNSGKQCCNLLHEMYDSSASIRVSLHVYNTKADIDFFFNAVEELRTFWV